jgi:hypothetical protein
VLSHQIILPMVPLTLMTVCVVTPWAIATTHL